MSFTQWPFRVTVVLKNYTTHLQPALEVPAVSFAYTDSTWLTFICSLTIQRYSGVEPTETDLQSALEVPAVAGSLWLSDNDLGAWVPSSQLWHHSKANPVIAICRLSCKFCINNEKLAGKVASHSSKSVFSAPPPGGYYGVWDPRDLVFYSTPQTPTSLLIKPVATPLLALLSLWGSHRPDCAS